MARSLGVALALGSFACAHRGAPARPTQVVTATAPTTPDAPFRASKPDPLAVSSVFVAPTAVERRLQSGARVLIVENHAVPLVAIELVVRAGVAQEPLDRGGLAGFTSRMLLEGTERLSSLELAIAGERLAAQLTAEPGAETNSLHLNALKATWPEAVGLFADVLLHPSFRSADIERVRKQLLTELTAKRGTPGAIARDNLARLFWGNASSWGLPAGGTPASLEAITRAELVRFHKTFFVPNNAVIAVAGDVSPDEVVAALDGALRGWAPGKAALASTPTYVRPTVARSVVVVDLPTASQSQVWTGWRAPKSNDARMLPLAIANNVFGGLFSSRLNLNVRQQKGYSYGVRSRVTSHRTVSDVQVGGGIIARHTAAAIGEYEKELDRMKRGDLGDEDVERAKASLVGALPGLLETNDAVAKAMASLVIEDLPLDYFAKLPAALRAIDRAQVVAAARELLDAERWPLVVVGPKAQILHELEQLQLGTVQEVTLP